MSRPKIDPIICQRAVNLLKEGYKAGAVALDMGVSMTVIYRLMRENKIPRDGRGGARIRREAREKALAILKSGQSLQHASEQTGLSRGYLLNLCKKEGMKPVRELKRTVVPEPVEEMEKPVDRNKLGRFVSYIETQNRKGSVACIFVDTDWDVLQEAKRVVVGYLNDAEKADN